VNALLIKLVGCWCFDAKLCYQHVQSNPIMSGLSHLMLAGDDPKLLAKTTTMPLSKPSLFVGKWGTRTTTVVLDWVSKVEIVLTQEILHVNLVKFLLCTARRKLAPLEQ
jgi:hypothetical protein